VPAAKTARPKRRRQDRGIAGAGAACASYRSAGLGGSDFGPGGCVRFLREICVVVSLCVAMWLVTSPAHGQEPATLSSFLGIGADQQSSNPAIQAAAKAKAAKHKICKKKAAIQYLAGMGCSPEHPEVGAALLAAMSDPDEPVRYEAVKAVLQTAGECQSPEQKKAARKALGLSESLCDAKKKCEKKICDAIDVLCGKAPPKEHKHKKLSELLKREEDKGCDPKADCPQGNGRGPCCSPDMRAKLMQLAYGRDDKGCFLEPSSRVREVAELALKACNACNGCNCDPMGGGYSGVRELPPVEERETAEYTGVLPYDSGKPGHCVVTDRPLMMEDRPAPEPTLVPEPAPTAPEPPAMEEIPTPSPDCDPMVLPEGQALRSVLRQPPERLACLPPERTTASARQPVPVLPARSPAASVHSPCFRPRVAILSWPPITDALTAVRISEAWLAPHERLDVQAEFSNMVGETVAERLSYREMIIQRAASQPQTPKSPTSRRLGATPKPPARTLVPEASRKAAAPPNPSRAGVSSAGRAAITGGCLLAVLACLVVGFPMARHTKATLPRFPGVARSPSVAEMVSCSDRRAQSYPQKPRK